MEIKIEKSEYVSYSEAKRILEGKNKDNELSATIERTIEYLSAVEKCTVEKASHLRAEIIKMGLKEETAAIIASICPSTLDELRSTLFLEEKTYSTDDLNKILELIKSQLER